LKNMNIEESLGVTGSGMNKDNQNQKGKSNKEKGAANWNRN